MNRELYYHPDKNKKWTVKDTQPTIFIDHDGFVDIIYNNTHTSRISKHLQRNSESPSKNSLLIPNIAEHWPGKH